MARRVRINFVEKIRVKLNSVPAAIKRHIWKGNSKRKICSGRKNEIKSFFRERGNRGRVPKKINHREGTKWKLKDNCFTRVA